MITFRSAFGMLTALALTASLGAVAVAADEEEAPDEQMVGVYSIEDMTWALTSQAIDGELVAVPEDVTVSLLMEDGRAAGNGGCNGYFASYELDGFDVSFGEIGSTLKSCLAAVNDVEHAYFANLGQVASYQSGGIQMAFLDAAGNFILEFDIAPAAGVVGSWVATGINDQRAENAGVATTATTSLVTAVFGSDGDLTGFDGCNDYFTTYVVDGAGIAISDAIGSTLAECPSAELAEQSQWYYGALAAATTWAADPGSLELRDEDGSLQVRYAAGE